MSRMGPDLSGMIPLDALEAQAAGVRRLSAGVADLAGTAENMLAGMQEVRDAGQWAEARDGLYRFEQDVMRELDSAGAADDLQARWKKALADRLPSYLPEKMSGRVKGRVEAARENLAAAGSIYLEKMSRLGQVEQARRSWSGSVESAVEQGDAGLAERRIEEGMGVFVTGEEAGRMAEEARDRVALNRAVEEVRRDPAVALPVVRAEQEGAPLNEMERKVAREAEAAYGELKRRYADSIFRTMAGGGMLRDEGLANAEKYGLVSPGQLRRYVDARDRMREAELSGISFPADEGLLCRMTRLIDEDCGGDGDTDAVIEVATSGLPAGQVKMLAERREAMKLVPQEVRRAASRRLSSMFRNGAWGPVTDARAVEEWKRVQWALLDAVKKNPANAAAEMERVFEEENRMQDAGWVGFRDMKNRKEKQ